MRGHSSEFWSPNLGRLYQSAISGEVETGELTQALHWRRGHMKSQPHGPRRELRKLNRRKSLAPGFLLQELAAKAFLGRPSPFSMH